MTGQKGRNGQKGRPPPQELAPRVAYEVTRLSDDDLYLFNQGSHFRLHEKFGAHLMTVGEIHGTYFAVWAPEAERV
ncbi:MAG: hypothetical protein ACREJK_08850, partial [Candidatus Methylomirabilales bacterium]